MTSLRPEELSQKGSPKEEVACSKTTIVVTGASGYIAGHIINELLKRNYYVIATLRTRMKAQNLYESYPQAFHSSLEIRIADLLDEESWVRAFKNVDYVIHTAAPFPLAVKLSEEEKFISTTVNGMRYVMNAAKINKVKKIVITSSALTIFGDFPRGNKRYFTENDWADPKLLPAYDRSKYFAEKLAWQLAEGSDLKMTSILPVFVTGPTLSKSERFSSMEFVEMLFRNTNFPYIFVPRNLNLSIVDVRDVALAHVRALETEKSNGKRYILCEQSSRNFDLNFEELAKFLREEFEQYGYQLKPFYVGLLPLKLASFIKPELSFLVNCHNVKYYIDNIPAINDLGMEFIDYKKSLIDMVYSLIEKGLIKDRVGPERLRSRL